LPDLPAPFLKEVPEFGIMQLFLGNIKSKSVEKFYQADCAYRQEKGWLESGRWFLTDDRIRPQKKIMVRCLEFVISPQLAKMFSGSVSATKIRSIRHGKQKPLNGSLPREPGIR
jgi:hypothetical protein